MFSVGQTFFSNHHRNLPFLPISMLLQLLVACVKAWQDMEQTRSMEVYPVLPANQKNIAKQTVAGWPQETCS